MAFPMFGTAAWLVWVLGQQTGINGAGALLALLVALSMLVWSFTLGGWGRLAIAPLAAAAFIGLALLVGPGAMDVQPAAPKLQGASPWQPWEPTRLDALVAGGRPVFVDFTASWCVTASTTSGRRWPTSRCWRTSHDGASR